LKTIINVLPGVRAVGVEGVECVCFAVNLCTFDIVWSDQRLRGLTDSEVVRGLTAVTTTSAGGRTRAGATRCGGC